MGSLKLKIKLCHSCEYSCAIPITMSRGEVAGIVILKCQSHNNKEIPARFGAGFR